MVSTHRTQTSYAELAHRIRAEGLLRRCYLHYWVRITLLVGSLVAIGCVTVLLGRSWWQLAAAAALGLVVGQAGFLSHEAAHRQIFVSASWNDWTARLLGGLLAGLSVGWWRAKHNRHHAAPNQEGRDPDIAPGTLAFTREIADRRRGAAGWFTRHQGWLLLPLLTLEGVSLHVSSLRSLQLSPGQPWRRTEAALILLRLGLYVVGLLWLLGPGLAAAFVAVQMAVFGLTLGGAFVPNHTGMPIVPQDSRIDFLQRQVLMSRNITGGPVVDLVMGGLNRQVEHHLFPSMARPMIKRAQPLVRAFCVEKSVPYTEVSLPAAYVEIIGYLNNVGLRARRPFECPLAAQYR